MKTKNHDHRFLFSVVFSLLLATAGIFVAGESSFFAYELEMRTGNSSEQVTTIVWGAPFHIVIDRPDSGNVGAIDRGDIFSGGAFLANWLFWFIQAWLLSYIIPIFFVFVAFIARFINEVLKPTESDGA